MLLYRVRLIQGLTSLGAQTRSGAELPTLFSEEFGIHLYVEADGLGIIEDQFSPYLKGVDVLGPVYEIAEVEDDGDEALEKHVL
jgi:hypothetical protein